MYWRYLFSAIKIPFEKQKEARIAGFQAAPGSQKMGNDLLTT
jgi:hypothetical protein